MKIEYKKQAYKYVSKMDANTHAKLIKAIEGLSSLQGDISKLKGHHEYRLKIHHYRVIFTIHMETDTIVIEAIGSRGDIYKGR